MRWAALILVAIPCVGIAQVPDVRIKVDLTFSLRSEKGDASLLKPYDLLGRHSTVALTFNTEPGFRVFVSEKVQRFSNETDQDPLEEYYVEDPGLWRVGKQFLPFGTGTILRESALAARLDTNLILERFPVNMAVFNQGGDAQQGGMVRIGTRIGASAAVGRHLGIASTAFPTIRRPEDSPGLGRGWKNAFGLDYTRRLNQWTVVAEGVAMREGETPRDTDLTVTDLKAQYRPNQNLTAEAGWTRIFPNGGDVFRLAGSLRLTREAFLEPIALYHSQTQYDLAIQLRIRF